MVEGGDGVAFQVVLFDGEKEINVGDVRIYPTLDFKTLQMMLSQKIGVSPNQITIYLCKKNKLMPPQDKRFRIRITGRANFAAIAREKDCIVLAVLKRSRSRRKHKTKEIGLDLAEYLPDNSFPSPPSSPAPKNLLLLRRNQPDMNNSQHSVLSMPHCNHQISQTEIFKFNQRLQNLQIQRENHEMAMSRLNSQMNGIANLDLSSFPKIGDTTVSKQRSKPTAKGDGATCGDCANAKERRETAPFHHCVNDPVIRSRWFRTAAGPIERRQWGFYRH